ncbi:SHOCT domain-containing protein [Dietzia aurantiaca]|nr:SHOCT domain-containing protein [Dietzia aurantiaca]
MQPGEAERMTNAFRQVRDSRVTPAPGALAYQSPDAMDQLRKLGELHEAGILTDDEFAAKKADLLGRL